jgi:outer membrane protein TolC
VSWPVYRAGSIRANIEVQSALQEQALAAYEQTVLEAVQELRDALSDYAREYERRDALEKAAAAARAAVAISQDQYRNGLTDFNSVLDAQRSLLTFEEAVALARERSRSTSSASSRRWEAVVRVRGRLSAKRRAGGRGRLEALREAGASRRASRASRW